ncbi:MAG: hypothetical protein R3186_04445 [Ruegeria sp.]|nr:hypothetical protein [Ruegeria sp.]
MFSRSHARFAGCRQFLSFFGIQIFLSGRKSRSTTAPGTLLCDTRFFLPSLAAEIRPRSSIQCNVPDPGGFVVLCDLHAAYEQPIPNADTVEASQRDIVRILAKQRPSSLDRIGHERGHLKRILGLSRLRPRGASDEFLLVASAQNIRKLAKIIPAAQQPRKARQERRSRAVQPNGWCNREGVFFHRMRRETDVRCCLAMLGRHLQSGPCRMVATWILRGAVQFGSAMCFTLILK